MITIQIKHTRTHTLHTYINEKVKIIGSLHPVNHEGHIRATNEKVKDRLCDLDGLLESTERSLFFRASFAR